MNKENLVCLRNNLRKEVEIFEKQLEEKVRRVLKELSKDQIKNMLGVGGYTISEDGDNCDLMRFIDDFEAIEILPNYKKEGSGEIILRFDELSVVQLITILDIAVLSNQ